MNTNTPRYCQNVEQINTIRSWTNHIADWYWQYGIHRNQEAKFMLKADWLLALDRVRQRTKLASIRAASSKPTVAIYGQSQAGKSTMMMAELDDFSLLAQLEKPETPVSALQWDDCPLTWGDWKNWKHASPWVKNHVASLNPFSGGKDATAIPTRFRIQETIVYDNLPFELILQTFDAVLAAAFSGVCNHGTHNPKKRVKKPELLLNINGSNLSDLQNAFILISGVYEMLDSKDLLLGQAHGRAQEITLPPIDSLFPCNFENALRWATELMFGEAAESYSNLISDLLSIYTRLQKYDKIYCDIQAMSSLLKFDHTGQAVISNICFKETASTQNEKTLGLFHTDNEKMDPNWKPVTEIQELSLMLYQLIICEIIVPVRADAIPKKSQSLKNMLGVCDLIDFPGMSKLLDDTKSLPELHPQRRAFILKSGKTECVLRDYVSQSRLDGFIIVASMQDNLLPSTEEVIQKILVRWDTENQNNFEKGALPFWWSSVCWNAMEASKAITAIDNQARAITSTSNCNLRLFATHYPIWDKMAANNALSEIFINEVLTGVKRYITDDLQRKSFQSLQIQALKPNQSIASTQYLWQDMYNVFSENKTKQSSSNRTQTDIKYLHQSLRIVLETNQAFPGGDQSIQNRHRVDQLYQLQEEISGNSILCRQVFSIRSVSRQELSRGTRGLSGSGSTYQRKLLKSLMSLANKNWRTDVEQSFKKRDITPERAMQLIKALEDSVWQVDVIFDQLIEEFLPLLPYRHVYDASVLDHIDGVCQLLVIRLSDWLTGAFEETHGTRTTELEHIFKQLRSHQATYSNRTPLQGDDELAQITGITSLWADSQPTVHDCIEGTHDG